MPKKKKSRSKKVKIKDTRARKLRFSLPEETQRWIWSSVVFLAAIIVGLSFFGLAGTAGRIFMEAAIYLIGKTIFIVPPLLAVSGIILLSTRKRHFLPSIFFSVIFGIAGVAGILGSLGIYNNEEIREMGGWVGHLLAWLPMAAFGIWVSLIIFFVAILLAFISGWQLIKERLVKLMPEESKVPAVIQKTLAPKFKVKEVPLSMASSDTARDKRDGEAVTGRSFFPFGKSRPEPQPKTSWADDKGAPKDFLPLKDRQISSSYKLPPFDLLEPERGGAQSGDVKVNSAIIKRTLENFGIPVEVSEINVGPAVTQYAIKPAEGIKLSRIVQLSNDLALALAAHPIRIEAPIPGRPLVGIEVPNRIRAQVRLRNLLEHPAFKNSPSHLTFSLGRDVAGNPVYADLARMPHLLVAGATGTGKTIGLNAIITSLLYQNSPEILRFIMIDPKRVEFPVYNDLPHLLTPVIFDAQKTVNVLKWLIGEMERRFDVISSAKARDIASYNQAGLKNRATNPPDGKPFGEAQGEGNSSPAKAGSPPPNGGEENPPAGGELMPYIVFIIDELADLMAARGREIEAGIVRLAQMSRAVGIHLVVATQRPSVEIITGLIKANITSRMTFQVASQVDSRTVLDSAGAERLLGSGDMLFISAELSKPKRIQGAYVSEKEVRKVVKFIRDQGADETVRAAKAAEEAKEVQELKSESGELAASPSFASPSPSTGGWGRISPRFRVGADAPQSGAAGSLAEDLERSLEREGSGKGFLEGDEDPLYGEARKLVTETKKASASFLQRRLRLGYARAARLIDMLEERGIVGPGEGAKPREVLVNIDSIVKEEENEGEWEKV